jgi:ABC-type glycerol-3-phosphate transport system permease component
MAIYLRDQHVQNLSLDKEAISQINNLFIERFTKLQTELALENKDAFFTHVIRFDHKGYRVFTLDELLRYFDQAHKVERLIFLIETSDALKSGRSTGAYLELSLDALDPARCVLVCSSDTKDWAEASFAAVHEVIARYKTRNGLARGPLTSVLIQLFGLVIGFLVSFWLAYKVSPNVRVENSFILTFLFILLVFSNLWGYLNQMLLAQVGTLFPNIEFIRPQKAQLHWLTQTIVGSAAFAIVVYLMGTVFSLMSELSTEFLKNN